jgi:branched-chain amino acid transport system substrate-binding protein
VIKRTTLLLLITFLLSLGSVRAAEPYDINVILSLTGQAAFLGAQAQTALNALESLENRRGGINGRPIHFSIVDDQTNPAVAVQLADRIIAKHVPVLLGPSIVANCGAISALVENGPVDYCLSPALHPKPGAFAFSAGPSTNDIALAALRFCRSHHWTRIALIASTDASGQEFENTILAEMKLPENKDLSVVADEHFNPADINIAAQVARIKASNPQALMSTTTGTPSATVVRGAHDVGLDVPTFLNAGNIVAAQLKQYARFVPTHLYLPGLLFMAPDLPMPSAVKKEQTAYFSALAAAGKQPDFNGSVTWDVARVVVDALRRLGPDANAVRVRDYIANLNGFAGVNGVLDYRGGNQRGFPTDAIVMVQWNPDKEAFIPVSRPGGFALK